MVDKEKLFKATYSVWHHTLNAWEADLDYLYEVGQNLLDYIDDMGIMSEYQSYEESENLKRSKI